MLNNKESLKKRKKAQYLVEFIIIAAPLMISLVFAIQTMINVFVGYWSLYSFSFALNVATRNANRIEAPLPENSDMFERFKTNIKDKIKEYCPSCHLNEIQLFETENAAPVFVVAQFSFRNNIANSYLFSIPTNRALLFPITENILNIELDDFFDKYYTGGEISNEGEEGNTESPPEENNGSPLGEEGGNAEPDSSLSGEEGVEDSSLETESSPV